MKRLLTVFLVLWLLFPYHASAQGISTIRDDEIEHYLRDISDPIFRTAGLNPSSIKIYIVNSPVLNAFVSGGQNLFIHTGLITESNDPSMLMGVIAHETGHIAGGHLILKAKDAENAGMSAVIGTVLGVASVAVGAPPQAGVVLAAGGQHLAERGFMKHSRAHEEAADQSAITTMDKLGESMAGLVKLLEKLNNEQALLYGDINPYRITHPLSSERIAHLKASMQGKKEPDSPKAREVREKHLRVVAKLKAFLQEPKKTIATYPASDNSLLARYSRAIAYYRIPKIDKALAEIESLIKDYPSDAYFHELKGQMLFENGRVRESIPPYEKALEINPDSALIKIQIAIAALSLDDPKLYQSAINHLEKALVKEKKNAIGWHQLGIAYGKAGDLGSSYLALAEEAAIQGNTKDVVKYISLAKKNLSKDSPSYQKAKDLIETLDKDIKKEMNKQGN